MSARLMRFVGNRDVNSNGKFLWEILAQLRDFGVGRMVTKNEWARRWPNEPSYLIVQTVEPEMDRWLSRGKLWAKWVFRGRDVGVFRFEDDLNRSDWRLIHRHEENTLTASCKSMQPINVPTSFPLPPLQKICIAYLLNTNCQVMKDMIQQKLLSEQRLRKRGEDSANVPSRAPFHLSIDPELQVMKDMIQQSEVSSESSCIYDEFDKKALLDLYGEELPLKIESWNIGDAKLSVRFPSTDSRLSEKKTSF